MRFFHIICYGLPSYPRLYRGGTTKNGDSLFMQTKTPPRFFFAALNTADGFKGYFSEIFGSLDRLYIIKGGPGTGKSRFITEIGKHAETLGRTVEYFCCSSDPRSLDGIIIYSEDCSQRFGVIDGTPPHAVDPVLPGAVDRIINLGDFWNSSQLSKRTKELSELNSAKERLYSSVYCSLCAVRAFDRITESAVSRTVDLEKMSAATDRLLRCVPRGDGYRETVRFRQSVGCDGAVKLNTYSQIATHKVAVIDRAFSANTFMLLLQNSLRALRQTVTVSRSPYFPDVPDAIYVPSIDTSFYVGSEGVPDERTVNMQRFICDGLLAPFKPKLRALSRLRRDTLSYLFTDYARIRSLHSATEAIYGEAMDFSQNQRLIEQTKAEIFGDF